MDRKDIAIHDPIVEKFLDRISFLRDIVKELYLFGSRCREDWRPDSDYDIMVVLGGRDRNAIDRLYDAVIDILLETGRLISLKIFTISEFERLRSIPTPFMKNVLEEGIKLANNN